MRKRINKLLMIELGSIVCLCLAACSDPNVVTVKNEEGQIVEKYQINEDSLRDGYFYSFYENGDTFEIANYEAGIREGKRKIFYEDNRVELEESYQSDALQGPYYVYYPSGALKQEMIYTGNTLTGPLTTYYEGGQIKERVMMEDNVENGPFTEYYKNGQKAWEGSYRDGDNEFGLLVQFAENGDTIKKMMCDDQYICRTFFRNENYPE